MHIYVNIQLVTEHKHCDSEGSQILYLLHSTGQCVGARTTSPWLMGLLCLCKWTLPQILPQFRKQLVEVSATHDLNPHAVWRKMLQDSLFRFLVYFSLSSHFVISMPHALMAWALEIDWTEQLYLWDASIQSVSDLSTPYFTRSFLPLSVVNVDWQS